MTITARYANAEQSVIVVSDGGVESNVPKDLQNKDYATLLADNVPIAAYESPPVTAEDVRTERDRRLFAVVGAANKPSYEEIVSSATREAVRLLRKGEGNWTADESARAIELEEFEARIAEIESRSMELEAAPPANYQDDAVWPAASA